MSGSINEAEGMCPQHVPSAFSHWLGPLLIAFLTLVTLVLTLDGVGDVAAARDAPGLTLDEIFNLEQGEYLWGEFLAEGPGWWTRSSAERTFSPPRYNPDHPPLGRLWIGFVHALFRPGAAHPDHARDEPVYQLFAARMASLLAFAATLLVVGVTTSRWYGCRAGTAAALALALLPRVFAHAHLAALETSVGLLFTATALFVAGNWSIVPEHAGPGRTRSPRWSLVLLAGLLFGLTLLTKIQAVLLPVPIGLWCLWQFRWRAVPLMLVFGLTGLIVFFAGWPWLWLDPITHLREYFASKAERPTLYCYYLGERYADVDVPWHYPFVMFLTTVPVGFLALGGYGLWRAARLALETSRQRDPRALLVAAVVGFVLAFFALPGITVYDGERLFLVVFPLWAVLVGITLRTTTVPLSAVGTAPEAGAAVSTPRPSRWLVMGLFLLGIAESLWAHASLHPCQLSYYNCLVGGLGGADRLGLEPTYWRDSVTRQLLKEVAREVPAGETVYVAPVLHPANRIDLMLLSPILRERELRFDSYDDRDPSKRDMRYVLVYRRHADPWPALEPAPAGGDLLAEVRRLGVQLAALYRLPAK
jgi:4-amino-4-deoxy-L-arabinose transferase-like glycosyltransferase